MRGSIFWSEHPLLRIGATLMFLALACAGVVLAYVFIGRPTERADAAVRPVEKLATESAAEPLVRTDPGIDPWVERDIPPPKPEAPPEAQTAKTPPPQPAVAPQPAPAPKPKGQPNPPKPAPERQKTATPTANDEPSKAADQTNPADQASNYQLPPGAVMTLSVPALGIRNAPVLNSEARGALDRGVVHLPDTSLPWSDTPERNVYLAGHRLGWPGTGSHLIFYRLNELQGGERITLRDREGTKYDYRVLETFAVRPDENWVTGRIRGRDLVTLQTCTPIPTFEKRLIVRAERI